MRKIKYLFILGAGGLVALLSFTRLVYAETIVPLGQLTVNTTWDKSGNPYKIGNNVVVANGVTLTIGSGVQVMPDSSNMNGYIEVRDGGKLIISGKGSDRVKLNIPGGINIEQGGYASIANADISGATVSFIESSGVIATSTFRNSSTGVRIKESRVDIWGSRFEDNVSAIRVEPLMAYLMRADQDAEIGGMGNALEDIPSSSPFVRVSNSAIVNNSRRAIENYTSLMVLAENNWWGSASGPAYSGANRVIGPVDSDPWLASDPSLDPGQEEECCSSVLFIPGLQGTRLYRDEPASVGDPISNQLWEPNRNADVEKLYLDSDGSSIDPSIYSGEPIGSALGFVDVYEKFMDHLDNLSSDGIINEWKSFGYDWRKPIDEVVNGRERKSATTVSLIDTLADLATRSKTGKVTLVAHSNGGLVAKYLVKALADTGKTDLVDSLISVGVPYLGTPQGIAALLHGDGQSIAGGIILSESVARSLGENMASAYSLLPSREYFSRIFSPTIAFASTTVAGVNNGTFPKAINTFEGQMAFISNSSNGRIGASPTDITLPINGNAKLLAAAEAIHDILDPFSWPSAIARWTIFGWNAATVKGIEYGSKLVCKSVFGSYSCTDDVYHSASTTVNGDGTVVAPSAAYNGGNPVSIDLKSVSRQEDGKIRHSNILEASSTQAVIDSIITRDLAGSDSEVMAKLSQIPGVSLGEPDYSKEGSFLVMRTHSPVELHVYDSNGRHTGLIPPPSGLSEDVEPGLYKFFEAEIPGSDFMNIGSTDEDPKNQIYIPDDNGEQYSVVLLGTGLGEFTFDVSRVRNGAFVDKAEFVGIPVTPLAVATTAVIASSELIDKPPMLASSTPRLSIDIDGNGTSDAEAAPDAKFDPVSYLELMKITIQAAVTDAKTAKKLVNRIDKLEDLVKKGKLKQSHNAIAKMEKRLSHLKLKNLTEEDRKWIAELVNEFIAQFE